MRVLALYTVGNIALGTPRPMQRTHIDICSGPSKGPLPSGGGVAARRWRPSAVIGGTRPSGGSITSDVRWLVSLRSSQCGGGDVAEPTAPALAVSALSTVNSALSESICAVVCFSRCVNSSSVSHCRSPYDGLRSKGTLSSAALDHTPWRSGSPHDVLGAL